MKVLFIYTNIGTLNAYHYNHGVGALSAALKKAGHQTIMHYYEELPEREQFLSNMKEIEPGLVCFSFGSHQWFFIRKLAGWLAESYQVPTVAGGPHATHAPDEVISHPGISMVCRGESEEAIVELVETLGSNKDISSIQNLWVKNGESIVRNDVRLLISDLDKLPFSDRELFDIELVLRENVFEENVNEITLMAGRGCPLNCTYCCNNALMKLYKGKGPYVRFRSVENVMEEIDLLAKRYKFDTLYFEDDVFTIKREWVEEFCKSYRNAFRFPFNIYARVEQLDKDLLALLKDAGLYNVRVGIESGNEKIRREVMNRRMTNEQIERMFEWLHDLDIRARTFNIVGVPGDTSETIRDTIRLNERVKPDHVQVSIFYPYPGTKLYQECQSKGYLSNEERSSFFDEESVLDIPELPRGKIKELYNELCDAGRRIEWLKWEWDLKRGMKGYCDFLTNHKYGQVEFGDPEMVKTDLFMVDGQLRHVLFEHPRARLTYDNIKLKEGAVLRFGIALSQRCIDWEGHGVRYRIIITHDGNEHTLFDHTIDPKAKQEDRCWHDFEIDLSSFGNSTISVSFITDPDESGDLTGAWAGWSRPHLICSPHNGVSSTLGNKIREKISALFNKLIKDTRERVPLQDNNKSANQKQSFHQDENVSGTIENQKLTYPKYNSPEVQKASKYIVSLTRSECRLNSFFRDYFKSSIDRIGMNLAYLRKIIKPKDHFLDVGSFGIEPAIIQKEYQNSIVKAIAREMNRIGIGPEGFYETADQSDRNTILIEEVDVENQRFPFKDNEFDIVTCYEVLEHLKYDPVHMMKEIKRVLKPEGILILTTPNINSLQSVIKILIGDSPQECALFHNPEKYLKCGNVTKEQEETIRKYRGVIHPKEYSLKQIRDLCLSLGFHIESLMTIDTRQLAEHEKKIVQNYSSIIIPIEDIIGPICKPQLGERVLLIARKGGPIISETPDSIFEQ
jgi:radical SAM superfamily enzyme YgiQ (UPF0313 family)/SAM-dependent methyltransferase